MMDIVDRLRATQDDWPACLVVLEQEAADEIERLRAALARLIGAYEEYVRQQYPAGSFKYPAVKRQHDVDMAPVVRARLALRGESNE